MKAKKPVVFFDFDNTITAYDVLDDMLERFSTGDGWKAFEEEWKQGKIGSRQCLKEQLKFIKISRRAFDRYLGGIKVDPYFRKLSRLLKAKKIKTVILSDNFDYILRKVLKKNGLPNPKIYTNRLRIAKDRLVPTFPFTNRKCATACAHCKLTNLRSQAPKDATVVYVGDGRSDVCPSKSADVVFAKDSLRKHFKENRLDHVPIESLKDVYTYFQRSLA